ncbi:hypothetical protein [Amycolatopsis sp. NPDC003861]
MDATEDADDRVGLFGARRPKPEWAYVLNNHDWPSEVPGPKVSKEDFYLALGRMQGVYSQAIEDLGNAGC